MGGGDSLLDKSRDVATVRKRSEKPATSCDRVLRRYNVGEETNQYIASRLDQNRTERDMLIITPQISSDPSEKDFIWK